MTLRADSLPQFAAEAAEASVGRTYDVEVGVCLDEDPLRTDNNQPFAPLPCANAVFNISGIEGTSYEVSDLTPGRAYSFRVVTRGGSLRDAEDSVEAAPDAGSVSAVAVATASGSGKASSSSNGPRSIIDKAPQLAFCGARRSVFPNGTLLLDGGSVKVNSPAACCLVCSRALGCNAWAHCDPENVEVGIHVVKPQTDPHNLKGP